MDRTPEILNASNQMEMQQGLQSFESIALDQHRVFLIFPLDTGRGNLDFLLRDTHRAIIDRIGSPESAGIAGQTFSDTECPWQRQASELDPDFNKRFRDLFSDGADANIRVYRLCPEALEVLNGSGHELSLELVLTGAARERINHWLAKKIHSSLLLTIHTVQIAWFKFSSVSMLIAEIEWRLPDDRLPLDIIWLVEGLYGLKQNNKLHWSRNRSAGDSVTRSKAEPEAFFTFPELLTRLIDHAAVVLDPRPYAASCLKTNDTPSAATFEAFGILLSQNYSLDYQSNPREANIIAEQPFDYTKNGHRLPFQSAQWG